jgi:hypothetical protein
MEDLLRVRTVVGAPRRLEAHLGGEVSELATRRQVTVDQEISDLEEAGPLGKLLDGVAPVAKDAGRSIDLPESANAGR